MAKSKGEDCGQQTRGIRLCLTDRHRAEVAHESDHLGFPSRRGHTAHEVNRVFV
ncbi:MAG: hypothetical protein OXU67_02395 [Chloroflexota bacterium]|nr:hypothetical protein [Chloroflexota bacterium]